MSKQSSINRRKVLCRSLGMIAGTALLAPSRWTKPVVDSVFLPAHAQTTYVIDPWPGPVPSSPTLSEATSESRTPSGGAPDGPTVDALNSLTFTACVSNQPGATATCVAVADLGGTDVDLGSTTTSIAADGSLVATLFVPATEIAPTAAVVSVTFTCTIQGTTLTSVSTFTQSQLSAALAGTASPTSC